MTTEDLSKPRISDLPVRELQPINPLGQHLPFPMNVNAPQEVSPPHEYLTFEIPPEPIRRRATLPSLHVPNPDIQDGESDYVNKAMARWDERQEFGSVPSPQIGIALSSPPPTSHSAQSRRRSRSAGALRDLAKGRPSVERRRSAEIRYWRNSYQSGSIYSMASPRPQTARTVETIRSGEQPNIPTEPPPVVVGEPSSSEVPDITEHQREKEEIQHPEQEFNFGDLTGTLPNEPSTREERGVRTDSTKRLSIEERVKNLEDNMRVLETSVRRISVRNNRQTIILENAPKGRNRSSSGTSSAQGSQHSSKTSSRTLSLRQESPEAVISSVPTLPPGDEDLSSDQQRQTVIALNPTATSLPLATQSSDLAGQIAELNSALMHERLARKALERQVDTLQREVTDLHALVNKFISQSPSYPTPSPDAIVTSSEERLATPRASSRPGIGAGYEQQRGSEDLHRKGRETMLSRFSQSDSEGEDDGLEGQSASITSSREDVTSPEAWATPKEEIGFGSGFFGSNPRE